MLITRVIKKFLIDYSGYGYLKWKYKPKGLYCFNYHRIGFQEETPFDPNVFSCTEERFEEHLKFYKENFEVINIDKLLDLIGLGKPLQKHYALITFDDGYIDNYEIAFPLLKKHKLPAVFFVPTNYIGKTQIPWWDEVAWMIKNSDLSSIKLSSWNNEIRINGSRINFSLRKIIACIKKNNYKTITNMINELKELTKLGYIESNASIFMDWKMLDEMLKSGMDIGAHGLSHKILSRLSFVEQNSEIKMSKEFLEKQLGIEVKAFAYPEGGEDTYNTDTITILKKENYKLAFNFVLGINPNYINNQYEIQRLSISNNCNSDDIKNLSSLF